MRQRRWQVNLGLVLVAGTVGCTSEPSISIVTKPMPARVSLAPQVTRTRADVPVARPAPPPPAAAPAPVANKQPEKPIPPPAPIAAAPPSAVVSNARVTAEVAGDEEEVAVTPAPAAPPSGMRPAIAPSKFKRPPMPSGMPSWFDEKDQDHDGMVGMYEWPADDLATFRKYDLNGDGYISIEEALRSMPRPKVVAAPTTPTTPAPAVVAAPAPPPAGAAPVAQATPAPVAVTIDDNDIRGAEQFITRFGGKKLQGKLAADEVPSWLPGRDRFAEFDKDKDGYLDNTELATMFKATRGQRGGGFGRDNRDGGGGPQRVTFGGSGGGGGPGGNRDPEAMAQRIFDRIKERGGGKVTIEAWTQSFMPREQFAEYDTNKDGVIDFDEFKTGFSRNGGNMFGRGGPRRGAGQ